MRTVKMPIWAKSGNEIIKTVDIERASSGVLADARKKSKNHGHYLGIEHIAKNTFKGIPDINQRVRHIPVKSVEYGVLIMLVLMGNDSGVEGIYRCPLCKKEKVCRKASEDDDTADYIEDLKVDFQENEKWDFTVTFDEPVIVDSSKEIAEINSMTFKWPTLGHLINAEESVGMSDPMRFQDKVFLNALTKINGAEIPEKWVSRYGQKAMDSFYNIQDKNKIVRAMHEFGINFSLHKVCSKCGNEWTQPIDSSNFFASALQ